MQEGKFRTNGEYNKNNDKLKIKKELKMKKLSFILCSLVFVFAVFPIISGAFNENVNNSEDQHEKEKIYKNHISKEERQQQEKELEKFLNKENKSNALLPLPNPNEKFSVHGMPLPDGENVEAKNLN